MNRSSSRRRLKVHIAIGSVVLAGVSVLGVLQFRWIRESNRSQMEQERRSIIFASETALEEAFEEIRALLSISFLSIDPTSDDPSPQPIVKAVELWRRETRAPDLLKSSLFVSAEGDIAFDVDRGDKAVLQVARYPTTDPENRGRPWSLASFYSDGVIVLPFRRLAEGSDSGGRLPTIETEPAGHLVFEIDLMVLFHEILRNTMETYLPGHPYRIVHRDKVLFAAYEGGTRDRAADVRGALPSPIFGRVARWNAPEGSTLVAGAGAADDVTKGGEEPSEAAGADASERFSSAARGGPRFEPDFVGRYWALRIGDRHQADWYFDLAESPRLEIYRPGTSLRTAFRRRIAIDLGLSYGALSLFIAVLALLYRAARRSERFRESEREFVETMSHELRTPVAVIRSISENIVDGVGFEGGRDAGRLREYGSLIRDQSARLGRMIESILMTQGLNRRASRAIPTEINVNSFVGGICQSLEPTAAEVGVSISASMEIDRSFTADPGALRLIVENLLINAIRHGVDDEGGGKVTIAARLVTDLDEPNKRLGSRWIRIEVSDSGQGVPEHEQRRIFEAFYRGERTRSIQTQGSGLGLYLVRRVARLHGGEVTVQNSREESGPPRGATFVVELPEGGKRYHGLQSARHRR